MQRVKVRRHLHVIFKNDLLVLRKLILVVGCAQKGNGNCLEIDVQFFSVTATASKGSDVTAVGVIRSRDDIFSAWLWSCLNVLLCIL